MGCGIAAMIEPYVDGTLDGIVLTHPHKEAVGDLREVLAAYTVRTVWKNTDTAGSGPYVDAMGMLDSDHLEVLTQPCMIGTNNIKLSVLNAAWGSDLDDNSLVIELMTKAGRFLFMGDAGKATEERLVANETLLPCKVLKVANHGAATATFTNFLEAVQPKDAVYTGSTASPSVIARLDFESDVYSINETGMLTIKIQGNNYIIERSK
jgi:beta-lactamase superfamily II metal-dependent hydrolase